MAATVRTAGPALAFAFVAGAGAGTAAAQPSNAEPAPPPDVEAVARGEYVFNAAGCLGCHTVKDGDRLAGGRALETPFGTFYTPNITPHPEQGIGGWSDEDFIRALREGVGPDGTGYFPAFPYTSYTHMSDADLRDLKAYLDAQPASAQENRPHDLPAPFGWRFLLPVWQALFLEEGELPPEDGRDASWHRGRYLVQALGHCGECHTPRNMLGAMEEDGFLAGTPDGPEGKPVPGITQDPENGIGSWSEGDIAFLLEIGMLPDGDFVGGGMNEVVEQGTSKLTPEDRQAIAAYLLTVPPASP
jgi:mono/diheme cytochrome c family protein